MKRDMDIVREILLAVEDGFQAFGGSKVAEIEGRFPWPAQIVHEHLHLMLEAGLLEKLGESRHAKLLHIRGLTWEGHDFLDTVRDPDVWKRTKEGASRMGGWTFGLLKDLGTAYLKHVAKERLGLDL